MILFHLFLVFPSPAAQGRGPPNSQQSTSELCCLGVTRQMCGQCRTRPPQMAAGSLGFRAPGVWDLNSPSSHWVDYWPQHIAPTFKIHSTPFLIFHSIASSCITCHIYNIFYLYIYICKHYSTYQHIYIYKYIPTPSYNQTRPKHSPVSMFVCACL